MTLHFKLDANDFLQLMLFQASKNERIKNTRIKTWLIYSFGLLLLSFIFYQSNNRLMTYYFLILGLISVCFFPFYQRWYYKNHYQKFIADTYNNRFGQACNLIFKDNYIETSDITGESKINMQVFENITETSAYFYLKIKTGGCWIIPKSQIDDVNYVRDELRMLSEKLSIPFINDLSWKWK